MDDLPQFQNHAHDVHLNNMIMDNAVFLFYIFFVEDNRMGIFILLNDKEDPKMDRSIIILPRR